MKKIILFLGVIVTLLAACSKEQITPNASESQITIVKTSYGLYCPSDELQYWESHPRSVGPVKGVQPMAPEQYYNIQQCTMRSGYQGCECVSSLQDYCSDAISCTSGNC